MARQNHDRMKDAGRQDAAFIVRVLRDGVKRTSWRRRSSTLLAPSKDLAASARPAFTLLVNGRPLTGSATAFLTCWALNASDTPVAESSSPAAAILR